MQESRLCSKCTIKEIKEKELPELDDDEFASEVSEFDTLAEYRGRCGRKNLTEKKEEEAKEREGRKR